MESILISIRKALGIEENYSGFDSEIIFAINTTIMFLHQLGVGPTNGFVVTGIDEVWNDLFNGIPNIEGIKSYILLKTRLEFDPPTNSFLLEAIKSQIGELAWRITVQADGILKSNDILLGIPIIDKPILEV